MVIHTWKRLGSDAHWYQFLEGFILGCWWGCLEYIQDMFLLVVPFLGETRVLRTFFFSQLRSTKFSTPRVAGYVFWNDRKHHETYDLSLKQRIFKCTVPKVTLNPGNVPLQLLLVGQLRSCITFKFHLHWSRRRAKWMPCPWTCSLTRKHSWGIILNNADLRAVVFLFTKKWAVAIMASQ